MLPRLSLVFVPFVFGVIFERQNLPVLGPRDEQVIEGKYIVVMKSDNEADIDRVISSIGIQPVGRFSDVLRGFVAKLTIDQKKRLDAERNVDYIYPDVEIMDESIVNVAPTRRPVYTEQEVAITKRNYEPRAKNTLQKQQRRQFKVDVAIGGRKVMRQRNAPWGLARISHRKPRHTTYIYLEKPGAGTCVYVLDSGLDERHPEFGGRATFIKNFSDDRTSRDLRRHGTHAAGIIGSASFGVAKNARIFGVKVVNQYGRASASKIIEAMDFVVRDAATRRTQCPRGVVAYTPVYSSYYRPINSAARNMVRRRIFLAVAAGDERRSVVTSPASEPYACTVGATTQSDALADFSNLGEKVNVLAPGHHILSTIPGGGTTVASGTAQAAAHVAGLGAYILSLGKSTPLSLCDYISKTSVRRATNGLRDRTRTPKSVINNGFKNTN
ncbi:hypothetical protein QQS21_001253 [Conoideocrella luteorostrata]|uniref:Peptidase S8/S53 domain-containing protein n=1 Tax=Conoideocrella luteorostrata TaxID=1105319 RepID=A0AAJ0CXI0_9HYPO|nr:hypothetical protein QQS21_001253 [Conoideocrella luteorostrata]